MVRQMLNDNKLVMKSHVLSHTLFAASLAALTPQAAFAVDPAIPNAGSILQQVQPVTPPTPSSTGTGLEIQPRSNSELPQSAPFLVNTLLISGNTLFDTATLHALVADAEGQTLTLAQISDLADRITEYYHNHGYPLARAFIPAQTIRDGVVRIEIIEARYGKINLNNRSRINDTLLQDTINNLQSGQQIEQDSLDHALLLISDIPGVIPNATLSPGEAVGTSDLLIEAEPGSWLSGNVALDDYGNRYTDRPRAGFTLNLIEPLHYGDILTISGLTSGTRMHYGYASYELLLNGKGTRMGGSYSALDYTLSAPFNAADSHGNAEVGSLWVRHPFMRSRIVNLYGQFQYDHKQLNDLNLAIRDERHLDNWTASLSGDTHDTLIAGGVNAWNVHWTEGDVHFDNTQAQQASAATTKTQGQFSKWTANLVRLQGLSAQNSLYFSLSGQWASKNLDSAEKMIAGGPYTVRAYDMGALSGDTGYLGTAEFRHNFGEWHGQWQGVAFVDSQYVRINKDPWVSGTNSATLSGVGAGINWTGIDQWTAKATIATPVGSTPSLIGSTNSVRAWVELNKAF